ncbi:MAG: sugar transferase [Deltaproteobacteria bacterium]|nr:sugar transferase [Deltaproteobacteria bacterium]
MTFYRRIGKRVLDLGLAVPALALLAPVGLAVGGLIRLKLGGPVLFRQQRPGRDGEVFEVIKFRSMSNARDADGELFPDEERLTPLGNRLRRLSLDELPTLWNVVRGDMSLVGPRPLLVQYLDRYTPEQRRRHDVLPGVTGWAQINGRNAISWEEKFEHDLWYVQNQSLRTDLTILFRTISQVLSQRGILAEGQVAVREFMGSSDD